MEISEKIRILRKQRGWSQEDLGYKLEKIQENGLSRQAISDWENGKSEPKLDNIRELARLFNVSFDVLLDDTLDLNDPEVLKNVMTESFNKEKTKTRRSVTYCFKYARFKKKIIVRIGLMVLFAVAATLLSLFYKGSAGGTLFGISIGFSIGFAILIIMDVISYLKGYGPIAGCLTKNHLKLEACDRINTTIYAPIASVEYIKLGKHTKDFCGDVYVKIKECKEPYLIKKIYKPCSLVNTFYQIVGPEKGLDEIKFE